MNVGKSLFSLMLWFLLTSTQALATVYYISPRGSDANTGLSTTRPLKTFAKAISKMACGDILNLMDGVYGDGTSTGKVSIRSRVCSSTRVLTVKALNQRKARILDNGSGIAVYVEKSAYITVDGLVLISRDNNYDSKAYEFYGSPARALDSHHLVFKNLLLQRPNRYGNNHLILANRVTDSLFEDNEFYDFHRHGIAAFSSARITIRRAYCATSIGGLVGGWPNDSGKKVDPHAASACVAFYPCTNCTAENIIADGSRGKTLHLIEMNASGQVPMTGSKILGSIGYKTGNNAVYINSRGPTSAKMPQNNRVENVVIFGNKGAISIKNYDAKSSAIKNVTVSSSLGTGIMTDEMNYGDGSYSTTMLNILSIFNKGPGLLVGSGIQSWSGTEINAYANVANYSPGLPLKWKNASAIDPKLGTCIAWVPSTSPMKKAGVSGADIGANVLYRYKNGALTTERLWNPTTGAFPRGALVAGINDIPGESLFDLHERLNINLNGCRFPAGY